MPSRLEKVKTCFQNMDIDGLKELLTHQDYLLQTSPKIFLEAIDKLFKTLKKKGNNSLFLYPTMGHGYGGQPKSAIQFIACKTANIINKSIDADHFKLIIYEEKEIIVFEIGRTLIYSEDFRSEGQSINVFIDEADKLPQYQNEYTIETDIEGSQAFKELKQLQEGIRDLSEYISWIEKYSSLFEENLYYDSRGLTKFHKFFRAFLLIRKLKYFNYEMYKFVAKKGYQEFLEIDPTKIEEIIPWLSRYGRIPIWLIPYYDKSIESNLKQGYFEFENCKIKIDDLEEILKFIHYFIFYKDHYTQKFEYMRFEYEFDSYDYHHPKYKGFFEVVSKHLHIPTKPIKIRNGEEPIESHTYLWALFREIYKNKACNYLYI
jgi:hypothetical protein